MNFIKIYIVMAVLFFFSQINVSSGDALSTIEAVDYTNASEDTVSISTVPNITVPNRLRILETDNQLVYHPKELQAPVFNPGFGLTYPTWKGDGELYKVVSAYAKIAYNRFTWNNLEPLEGNYEFALLKEWIAKWKDRGFKVAFGVMSTSLNEQATPPWVFDAGVPGVSHMQGSQIDPVYWDRTYLGKLDTFITALGYALRDVDGIEFIDMRGIGVWGEMHFGGHIEGMWTNEELMENGYSGTAYFDAYKSMIDSYKGAFPDTPLFLNISPNHDIIVEYAVNQGINLRFDGLALSSASSSGQISEYFKKYGYPRTVSDQSNFEDCTQSPPQDVRAGEAVGGWKVSAGMTISEMGDGCIKLSGEQKDSWSYAYFTPRELALEPNETYQVSGCVKVESISNELNPPYFNFQVQDENGMFIQNYSTNKYDMCAINTWQRLNTVFSAGEVEKKGVFVVEKGKKTPMTITVYVKDLKLGKMDEAPPAPSPDEIDGLSSNGVRSLYEFAKVETDNMEVKNILEFALSDPVSYINLNYLSAGKILTADDLDIIKSTALNIGYRFCLDKIKMPKESSFSPNVNMNFSIEQTWKNKGASPCYENHKLRYILTDSAGREIFTINEDPEIPVWKWFPRVNIEIRSNIVIPSTIEDGRYSLKIGMVDSLNTRHIHLPLENYDGFGCYNMFDIKISTRDKLRYITPVLK